ncbi:Uncharacterised protein [Legionella steigerwaltii]|uniref:Uncharacterized protein n=1 Tax=Legionella steigerwaltii TaxID=460 RepID=A0A378LCZ6_9GAMM|nr:hypothetical protein [Legionella steigerwaltii]KTD75737.1 hypothetical protein Lstg_2416 [Legionella steigerwaltii]STY23752.1 Uncharacterised protein [Legionella steigerwaltii]
MGSIHIPLDEHLKRIMDNPSDAVLKQLELSEETYPLLISYLGWLRRLNGVQNKNDVIRQNEQIFSEFIYLCEHNLLFFLTVTGRFDVIRKLFADRDLLTKEIALLNEIEKEQAKAAAAKRQDFVFVPRKESSILQQLEEPKPHRLPISEWEKSLYGLTHMDLYQYYEDEMKRITYVHHMKQIKLVDASYEEHITMMRKALVLIVQDEHINEEKKQKAIAIYQSLIAKKEEMQAKLIGLQPLVEEQSDIGALNIEIIEQQRRIKEEHLKEAQEILEGFFAGMRDESPQLQAIYEEHQENIRNFKEESQAIQLEWEQEMRTLSVHYENARIHALEDIESSLHLITDELKKCPVDELDTEQIDALDGGIIQLKLYQDELKKAESYEAMQLLLSKCNKELETIAGIVQPVLPDDVKKRFELYVNLMKQMIAAPKDGVDFAMPTLDRTSLRQEHLDEGSVTSIHNTHPITEEKELEPRTQDVELESMGTSQSIIANSEEPHLTLLPEEGEELELHTPVAEHKSVEMSQPIVTHGDEPHVAPLPKNGKMEVKPRAPGIEHARSEIVRSTTPNDEKPQTISLSEEKKIEPITVEENPQNEHRYRFFVNSIRDGTEFEFDPEKQRKYESALKELSSILKDLKEEVEPEVSIKIKEIECLIKDAKSISFDKATPDQIQRICDACDLGIDYEPLNHAKNSLSSMVQLKNNPQRRVGT